MYKRQRIGYPVLVRPSYVLGGRAMQIVPNEEALRHYLKTAVLVSEDQPVLVDHYITGKELELSLIHIWSVPTARESASEAGTRVKLIVVETDEDKSP